MTRPRIKVTRLFISLNAMQTATMQDLMAHDMFMKGEESAFVGSLLVAMVKCRAEHGKGKQGRPKKQNEQEPELDIPEDNLSFSDDEIAKLKK